MSQKQPQQADVGAPGFDDDWYDRIIDDVDQQILEHYLEIDDRGRFTRPPATDEELKEFIEIAFGIVVCTKVVEPGHKPPFQFLADCFFERVDFALAFANRNGGKTICVAVLNVLDMLFKSNCEIASAGAVKDQAKKAYAYFQAFLEQQWFKDFCTRYERKVGRRFVQKEIQEETVFGNRSVQQILTATSKGLRSPHPHKARIDEIDEIEWSILQTGLSMTRSSRGIRAQNVFTSTRQHLDGSMQRLLEEAKERGISVYEWNIWESLQRCTRRCFQDPEFGDCPIFAFCQGKAHECDGFYEIGDFINKVRQIDQDTFDTEWLNKKPSREKLVYNAFNSNLHVLGQEELFNMTGCQYPSRYWQRISGIDFGGGPDHPFVYLKLCLLPNGAWLVFHEYVAWQKTMREHAAAIKASPYYVPGDRNYSDHARQDRIELKEQRIRTWPAEKDVRMGINEVKTLLKGFPVAGQLDPKPMLYVWYECSYTIKEFSLYSWPIRKDGKPDKTGVPDKKNDHAMDALRYAVYSYKRRPMRTYRARKVIL